MRLSFCVLVFSLFIGIACIYAEETDSLEKIDLGEIIISNRRSPISVSEATENVSVVAAEQIKDLPARDLSEFLIYIPGIDVDPRQGFGRATSFSIQGCDARQVRVMIDGIPFNNQASGQVDPTKLPIENADRIEVLKGASSSIWGSSLGGVVNIITKDTGTTTTPKISLTASFAEFSTRKQSGEASGKIGQFGYYLFSSYMESNGRGLRDDVLEKKAFGKLSYDFGDLGTVIASFGYSGADVNSGEFPSDSPIRWQSQPYRARYGKVSWEKSFTDIDVKVDLKHSRQDIITESFLSLAIRDPFWSVKTQDKFYQASLKAVARPREKDLLVFGADFDWNMLKSNLFLSESISMNTQAPYVNYTLKLKDWDLNFGLRLDRHSEFGQEVSPSIGAVYRLKCIPETLLRAGVSRDFNAPPLLWKFNEDVLLGIAPNPDIGPELAWMYELGLESRLTPELWVKLSLYRADVSDALALEENRAGLLFMKNFEKFRRQGVELQLKADICPNLNLFCAGAFNDIEDRATGETVKGGGKARYAFDLGIEFKNNKGLKILLLGNYDFWNEPADSNPNDRKMILDARISQEFKNLILFLNIFNLTNSKYWRDYFFPIPERYFEGGFTFSW